MAVLLVALGHAGVPGLGGGFVGVDVCLKDSCPAVIGHTIAYRDNNHVGLAYSLLLAGSFRAGFLRATH